MLLLFQSHMYWSSRPAHHTGYKAVLTRIVQEKVSGDRVGCDFTDGCSNLSSTCSENCPCYSAIKGWSSVAVPLNMGITAELVFIQRLRGKINCTHLTQECLLYSSICWAHSWNLVAKYRQLSWPQEEFARCPASALPRVRLWDKGKNTRLHRLKQKNWHCSGFPSDSVTWCSHLLSSHLRTMQSSYQKKKKRWRLKKSHNVIMVLQWWIA